MKKIQRGFTLIELVMVMVVLGSLAAVAMPKYMDFKVAAASAAAKGVAGALGTASAINFAQSKIDSTVTPVTTCADVPALLVGGVASNFTIATGTAAGTCTVTNTEGGTAVTWSISS